MAPSRKPAPEPVQTAAAAFVAGHPEFDTLRVALSGGRDSVALLHALARVDVDRRVQPVHVHHGLHGLADAQAEHCRQFARDLGYVCTVREVIVPAQPEEGVEAAARRLRYQALALGAGPADCILTAHHASDQAETFLLAALKGSGPAGLAAMPRLRRIGTCWLGRPLLDVPGTAVAAYAAAEGLRWIEDPSNRDTRFDRNFLRQEIVPRLRQRFPVDQRLPAAARLQAEVALLIDSLLDPLLDTLTGPNPDTLDLDGLLRQDELRRPWLLRRFATRRGLVPPRRGPLLEFLRQLDQGNVQCSPELRWNRHALRTYRRTLYLGQEQGSAEALPIEGIEWPKGAEDLRLPDGRLLTAADLRNAGLTSADGVRVAFRQGGEWLRLPGGVRRSLKNLMQERGVPPWRRATIPLIRRDGVLVAVLWDR